MVESLLSICKVLGSILSTRNKKGDRAGGGVQVPLSYQSADFSWEIRPRTAQSLERIQDRRDPHRKARANSMRLVFMESTGKGGPRESGEKQEQRGERKRTGPSSLARA